MPLSATVLPSSRWAPIVAVMLLVMSAPSEAQKTPSRAQASPSAATADMRVRNPGGTERAEAESIAEGSPDVREGARRLKLRGIEAAIAISALRSVFHSPERDLYQALLAARYLKPDLLQAYRDTDRLAATAFDRKLVDLGEPPPLRALMLLRFFPGFDFDRLFALMQQTRSATHDNFLAVMSATDPTADQIVRTGHRYHAGHQLPDGRGRYFPQPADVHAMVRAEHPGTRHVQIWSQLLRAGYAADLVFSELPIGEIDRSGRPLDAVAGCVAARFPGMRPGQNPSVVIRIAADGSASFEEKDSDCYATFAQQLRSEGTSRSLTTEVIGLGISCQPVGNPHCAPERSQLIDAVLERAGFAPEKR